MVQSLRSEATKSEDMFAQYQETQESVRLAFLNCYLDFAGMIYGFFHVDYLLFLKCPDMLLLSSVTLSGHLERIGSELSQNKTSKEDAYFQNGYTDESEDKSLTDLPGSVVDAHQRLLLVLSNIGYCKDELSYELYNKYKHVWLQSRYIVPFFDLF